MVRDTLQEIAKLLEKHDALPNELASALLCDEKQMWDFIISNEFWGGAGSIADEALIEIPNARSQLERLMIKLGREQMSLGRVNVRTNMWVAVFEKWQAEGIR